MNTLSQETPVQTTDINRSVALGEMLEQLGVRSASGAQQMPQLLSGTPIDAAMKQRLQAYFQNNNALFRDKIKTYSDSQSRYLPRQLNANDSESVKLQAINAINDLRPSATTKNNLSAGDLEDLANCYNQLVMLLNDSIVKMQETVELWDNTAVKDDNFLVYFLSETANCLIVMSELEETLVDFYIMYDCADPGSQGETTTPQATTDLLRNVNLQQGAQIVRQWRQRIQRFQQLIEDVTEHEGDPAANKSQLMARIDSESRKLLQLPPLDSNAVISVVRNSSQSTQNLFSFYQRVFYHAFKDLYWVATMVLPLQLSNASHIAAKIQEYRRYANRVKSLSERLKYHIEAFVYFMDVAAQREQTCLRVLSLMEQSVKLAVDDDNDTPAEDEEEEEEDLPQDEEETPPAFPGGKQKTVERFRRLLKQLEQEFDAIQFSFSETREFFAKSRKFMTDDAELLKVAQRFFRSAYRGLVDDTWLGAFMSQPDNREVLRVLFSCMLYAERLANDVADEIYTSGSTLKNLRKNRYSQSELEELFESIQLDRERVQQIQGIRDPDASIVENVAGAGDHMKRLAEQCLQRAGEKVPECEEQIT